MKLEELLEYNVEFTEEELSAIYNFEDTLINILEILDAYKCDYIKTTQNKVFSYSDIESLLNKVEEITEFPEQSTFNEDDMSKITEEEEKKDEDKND